ncbi:hypothetical protein J1N35_044041 [Gossypium stocksii]|uniref:Uncharacterized protein n=1 Tax=Gossypium stocksii TaxID=47602 RepID=A0A9D3ZFR9_9ROSI|nr:hypothetical protein J1N35_044041 [Gossypium stocksii]
MGVSDSYALDSSLVQLLASVVVPQAGIVVPPTGDLLVGVGKMTHLDKTINPEVFASSMAKMFESNKAMGLSKKKSSLTVPRVIPHATTAYILTVDSE